MATQDINAGIAEIAELVFLETEKPRRASHRETGNPRRNGGCLLATDACVE